MALVLRPIEQIQFDSSNIWLLDWFGGLVDNPRDFSNPSIECVLTPCTLTPNRASGVIRHIGRQVGATVGVAALGAIRIGGQYINGEFSGASVAGYAEETIIFRIDADKPESIDECSLDQIGIDPLSMLISAPLGESGIKSCVKSVHGELIHTNNNRSPDRNATPDRPAFAQVLFHELEIIRFYYTNSTRLIRAVFNNQFAGENLVDEVIYTGHEGPHYDWERGHHRFEYRLGFYRADACIIARAVFDPTQTAMEGMRRISQSIIKSKINEEHPLKTGYPRTKFPFRGVAELTLTGRRVRLRNGNFIFVVHRIESCSGSFPFEDLSFQCEIEPGGPPAPEGSPEAFPERPPVSTGPGQSNGIMDSEGCPIEGSESVESMADIRRFTGLNPARCVVEKFRPNTHTSSKNPWKKYDLSLIKSSPGTPTHGRSDAVKQSIVDTIEGGEVPVDLKVFVEILYGLKLRNINWKISTISISASSGRDPQSNTIYSCFPAIACAELTRVPRQFSFMDREKTIRRKVICAQLEINGECLYLLEAERRHNDQGGYMEELPILMLWATDRASIGRHIFDELLILTVENTSKTWPQDLSRFGLELRRIQHGKARNIADLVDRVDYIIKGVLVSTTDI